MLLRYNIQGYDRNMVKHLTEKDMQEALSSPFYSLKSYHGTGAYRPVNQTNQFIDKKILERAKENYTFGTWKIKKKNNHQKKPFFQSQL